MPMNICQSQGSPTCAGGKLQFHHNKQKQEKLQILRRSKRMDSPTSLESRGGSGRNHRARFASATLNLFIISACVQVHGFQSYSVRPVTGTYSNQHTFQSKASAYQHANAQNKQLYISASSDNYFPSLGAKNETMKLSKEEKTKADAEETKSQTKDEDDVFDNLLPSTMASPTTSSRMGMRPMATGPSSSALLPMSEQPPPLFQTANMQTNPNNNNNPATATEATSWKERLVDVSNLASLLCVLDCTLLPLVSVAIPALSWGVGALGGVSTAAASSNPMMASLSSFMAILPALSHGIALYFVIPVGVLTTLVNYFFGHKEVKFSLLSLVGVALIYVANSNLGVGIPSIDAWLRATGIATHIGQIGHGHGHSHDACGAVVGAATGMMAHTCPEGLTHRLTNTLGCASLLGSNYLGKKFMENKSGGGCAASALAEAWGGDSAGGAVCPPGCNCQTSVGPQGVAGSVGAGETFFQWDKSTTGRGAGNRGMSGGRSFGGSRFRR